MPRYANTRPPRGQRRERMWGITSTNGTVAAATHAGMLTIDMMTELRTDVGYTMPAVTASALRFNIDYRPTVWKLGDDVTVAMGVIWATEKAIVAGGVALPDPSADQADWLFHDIRTLICPGTGFDTSTDSDVAPRDGRLVISNDSMRKQRENQSTLVMLFRVILLQATSLQVFVGGRTLFILP